MKLQPIKKNPNQMQVHKGARIKNLCAPTMEKEENKNQMK